MIGQAFSQLWQTTGLLGFLSAGGWGNAVMILVGFVLLYLAIAKGFEPLLLIPIGFGCLLANIPFAYIAGVDPTSTFGATGFIKILYDAGIETGLFPILIFIGVGAMTDFGPLIANPKTLAFDTELFGHWWFEGIAWLESLLRKADQGESVVFETPTDYLRRYPDNQELQPALSSWGEGGYSDVWASGSNVWIYRHLHKAIERMEELSVRFPNQSSLKQRFLNQAAREVLLAMSSDWPFIIHNGTFVTYAESRIKDHLGNFNVVYENMCKNAVNTEWLVKAEKRNIVFPDIDYNIFNPDSDRIRYNG
jgi:hypothetical protein